MDEANNIIEENANLAKALDSSKEMAEALSADLATAQGDLEKANAEMESQTSDIIRLSEQVKELQAEKEELEEQNKQLEDLVSPVEESEEAVEDAPEEKEELATVSPVELFADSEPQTPEALREHYGQITDAREKGRFFAKHRDQILSN
jgi:chromosome segregation ATPase